ncbi:MAG: Wzt carbohydrate-binding domain-containing protein [Lautropia sp.]|nr:Wzt carbohydrate-binding domain-containing protein [Lautropia sp.]
MSSDTRQPQPASPAASAPVEPASLPVGQPAPATAPVSVTDPRSVCAAPAPLPGPEALHRPTHQPAEAVPGLGTDPQGTPADGIAIQVDGLKKCFLLYDQPAHMLKQQIVGRLARLVGRQPPRYFREYWALKGIDFNIRRGEVVGIVGRNGAGKSTLLQILCGTLAPTEGTVEMRGRVAALLELGAGFNPDFTGRENVYLNGAILGISREEIDRRFAEIEAFADIGEFIDRPVKSYSSGMYVRLAFAVSACVDPDILIVDEALAVGDAKFQAKCFRRFEELVARGTTILLVTHSIDQITRHCDRAILLEGGVVHQIGPPKDVANTYLDLMFGVVREDDASGEVETLVNEDASTLGDVKGNKHEGRESGAASSLADKSSWTTEDPVSSPDYSRLAARVIRRAPGRFEDRVGYNADEFRWGSQEVEIVDYLVTTNGVDHTVSLVTGQKVYVVAWVRFRVEVTAPIFGLTIKTPDGVTVYGSNSRDFPGGPVIRSAQAGEVVRVVFQIDLRIGAGDFLMSLGVAREVGGGEVEPLDRRYDSILVNVRRSSRCHGLADFDMRVEIEGYA